MDNLIQQNDFFIYLFNIQFINQLYDTIVEIYIELLIINRLKLVFTEFLNVVCLKMFIHSFK